MGLESMPYMALGNTHKGMTQIVMSPNANTFSYSEWLGTQKDEIVEAAYQNGRRSVARHVLETNALCLESHIQTPTVRSLGFFSEFVNISGSSRLEQKLLAVKNPVAFGALVYSSTKKLTSRLGAKVSYYRPSGFVGLELAERGLLNRKKFVVDYNSKACTDYADEFEYEIKALKKNIEAINSRLECINSIDLGMDTGLVRAAVTDVLQAYHSYIYQNVRSGLLYTIIEDNWLARKMPEAQKFANKILDFYEYAETNGIVLSVGYPRYHEATGFDCMKTSIDKLSVDQYALYSEVFSLMKGKAIHSSAGKRYQLGYVIPQMEYARLMNKDLSELINRLDKLGSLRKMKI